MIEFLGQGTDSNEEIIRDTQREESKASSIGFQGIYTSERGDSSKRNN